MNILVINTGSSSIKFQLVNTATQKAVASGLVERIGQKQGTIHYSGKGEVKKEMPFPDHRAGLDEVARLLQDKKVGVISNTNDITACGHRAVHGGEKFNRPVLVDDKVLDAMRSCIPLAPLHNPANITGIEVAASIFPNARHVAVFDTAFHQSMPPEAYRYAIPDEYYREDGIRRYGFHGTSHLYVSKEATKLLKKNKEDVNIITVHIGNGGSIAAIKGGKSVDTTMGMTPLAGLVMGTRCGDIDPALPNFLCQAKGLSIEEIDTILNKKSGLLGLTGHNDLRDVLDEIDKGDENCKIALDIYTYSIKKAIASYYAALNTVDAIVFTAGVGENSDIVRKMVCTDMSGLGIEIDESKNEGRKTDNTDITGANSRVKIFVIPTNEELEIANQTVEVLNNL